MVFTVAKELAGMIAYLLEFHQVSQHQSTPLHTFCFTQCGFQLLHGRGIQGGLAFA